MTTAIEPIARYLDKQRLVLVECEAEVRRDGPDSVHRSRVATRRTRSILRGYRRLFAGPRPARLRAELAWHADLLGAPRDAEVLLERLTQTIDRLEGFDPAAAERLVAELTAEHRVAHQRLVGSMDTDRYRALRRALDELLAAPPLRGRGRRDAGEVLPGLLARTMGRVDPLVARATDLPANLSHWHEVRKAAKAARYSSEALVPDFGAPAEELAAAWEQVTEALGEAQDSVVAEGVITRLAVAARAAGEPGEPYLRLESVELANRQAALGRGREALARAQLLAQAWRG